jgi:hypothetical protein
MRSTRIEGWTLWHPMPVYIMLLVLAVLLQARYTPAWLVESRAGLQTISQAIPATVIALFVLAFTTLFVVVQQTVTVFSSRAPLLLASDKRVKRIVARTALVAILALLIGGKVPDQGKPPSWLTATGATIVVATLLLVFNVNIQPAMLAVDGMTVAGGWHRLACVGGLGVSQSGRGWAASKAVRGWPAEGRHDVLAVFGDGR